MRFAFHQYSANYNDSTIITYFICIPEKKLKSIRAKNKVVENLSAYRADCIERLMREGCDLDPVIGDTEEDRLIEDEPQ